MKGQKNAIDAKKEVTTAENWFFKEQQNQVQEKKNAQKLLLKMLQKLQTSKLEKLLMLRKFQNSQDVLNGTGADKVIKERKKC